MPAGPRANQALDNLWKETLALDKEYPGSENVIIRRLSDILVGYTAPRKNEAAAEFLNWMSSKAQAGLPVQTVLVSSERMLESLPRHELQAAPLATAAKNWVDQMAGRTADDDLLSVLDRVRQTLNLAPAATSVAAARASTPKTQDVSQTIRGMMEEGRTLSGEQRNSKVLEILNVVATEAAAFKRDRRAQEKAAGFMQQALHLVESPERSKGEISAFVRTWVRKAAKSTDIVSTPVTAGRNGNGSAHDNLPGALADLLKETLQPGEAWNTKHLKAKWERVAFGPPQLRTVFVAAVGTAEDPSQHVALVVKGAVNHTNTFETGVVTVKASKPRAPRSATNGEFAASADPVIARSNGAHTPVPVLTQESPAPA